MSSFSFSFDISIADGEQGDSTPDMQGMKANEPNLSTQLVAISCFEVPRPQNQSTDDVYIDFSVHRIGDFVFKEALNTYPGNTFDEESDLIPGKYEGGFKIWECSYDLARIVADSNGILPNSPKKILELGCGHGVPAIMSMLVFEDLTEIVFSDFNSEVLELTTWPNIVLNCPTTCENVRCVAGDWATLSPLIGKFDLILSAETLYSVESCRKVC